MLISGAKFLSDFKDKKKSTHSLFRKIDKRNYTSMIYVLSDGKCKIKFSFLRLLYPGVINSKYKSNVASMFYYNESIFYWFKDNADHLLFDHDLSQDSLVIDVGAYHGNWCKKIFNKYQCNIYAYEPVKKHFLVLEDKMKNYNKIIAYNCHNRYAAWFIIIEYYCFNIKTFCTYS